MTSNNILTGRARFLHFEVLHENLYGAVNEDEVLLAKRLQVCVVRHGRPEGEDAIIADEHCGAEYAEAQ